MVRVLIGDDHVLVREGLRNVLSREPDMRVVGEAGDREGLLALADSTAADVVVMDINMPGASAAGALMRLRKRHPQLPVLLLSMLPEDHVALGFLKLGAAGFVSKATAAGELVTAIRTAVSGRWHFSPTLAQRMASGEPAPREVLSARELEVLRLLATGLAVKEIADRLTLSPSTVHTHRARILGKLQLRSDVELSRYAVRNRLVE